VRARLRLPHDPVRARVRLKPATHRVLGQQELPHKSDRCEESVQNEVQNDPGIDPPLGLTQHHPHPIDRPQALWPCKSRNHQQSGLDDRPQSRFLASKEQRPEGNQRRARGWGNLHNPFGRCVFGVLFCLLAFPPVDVAVPAIIVIGFCY